MPKHKSSKTKSIKSKLHSSKTNNLQVAQNNTRLINLFNSINNNRKDLSKIDNNLPAKLMQLNNSSKFNKNKVYAKSISSTYSSVMHNGNTHTQGKRIINESNKPFLQVDEMENGTTHHYMIPKNSIPYKTTKLISQHSTKKKNNKITKKHSPKK
jgi:hypothetical protein